MSKCINPNDLIRMIETFYNKTPDQSTIGQFIFRFDNGLICNVYSNGTVLFQGRSKDDSFQIYKTKIDGYVEDINNRGGN